MPTSFKEVTHEALGTVFFMWPELTLFRVPRNVLLAYVSVVYIVTLHTTGDEKNRYFGRQVVVCTQGHAHHNLIRKTRFGYVE